MKRRNFLKKLGIMCGAAVVCPTELLKSKIDLWIKAAASRKKNAAAGGRLIHRNIILKARQQGITTKFEDFIPYWKRIQNETPNTQTTMC